MGVNTVNGNELSIPDGYKKSKVGIIPEDWKIKKFKDITTILKCGIASTPTYVEDGVPFLSSQNVKENKFILDKYKFVSEEFHKKLTKNAKPQRGDILYTRVGASFGKAAVVDFDWEFSVYVSLTLIRMKEGYNNYFYSYLLNSDKYVFNAQKTVFQGGGVQNLNVKEVEKFDMVVPPIKEQNKIAEILLTWDKAIELKEKLIKQKKKQKKGILQKLLTGEVRLPGFEGEWISVPIEKVCNLSMGKTPRRNQSKYWGKGYKWIAISDMKEKYISETQEEITELAVKETGIKIIPKGTVIMSFKLTIGRLGITAEDMYSNEAIVSFTNKYSSKLDNEFLYYYLGFIDITKYGSRAAKGITLNKDSLKEIIVKLPSIDEQKKIRELLTTADKEINLMENDLEAFKQQKRGLMQLLLTGKLRVRA